jgi:hypothetical protein
MVFIFILRHAATRAHAKIKKVQTEVAASKALKFSFPLFVECRKIETR